MSTKLLPWTLVLIVLCVYSLGQTPGSGQAQNPVGAWHVTVTREPPALPFQALHVYNFGGTTTSSNTACNAIVPSASGLWCGDAYGVWEGLGQQQFAQTFLMHLYDPAGQHFAFIKAVGVFTTETKDYITGSNEVFLLVGTDVANPDAVIPLGAETVEGWRIHAEVPE